MSPLQTSVGGLLAGALCLAMSAGGCAGAPSAAEGQQLYRGNGCATCHGPLGRGDGPVGRTLTPPPRDFRDAHAFKNGTSVEAIAQTLEDGLTRDGSQMPRFDHLSARERQSLALFVISIRNQSAMDTSRRTP
ncbi:MAG TPA: cytochrome c [Vicinamibacterales bacterium]|nr:cytochrome c [Vicinamibacterales bacterium]